MSRSASSAVARSFPSSRPGSPPAVSHRFAPWNEQLAGHRFKDTRYALASLHADTFRPEITRPREELVSHSAQSSGGGTSEHRESVPLCIPYRIVDRAAADGLSHRAVKVRRAGRRRYLRVWHRSREARFSRFFFRKRDGSAMVRETADHFLERGFPRAHRDSPRTKRRRIGAVRRSPRSRWTIHLSLDRSSARHKSRREIDITSVVVRGDMLRGASAAGGGVEMRGALVTEVYFGDRWSECN